MTISRPTQIMPTHSAGKFSTVLKTRRQDLIATIEEGNARPFILRHAEILDDYFRRCFEASLVGPQMDLTKNPYAIIAQGGYGRAEQCVFSDVDLLFLFEKNVPGQTEQLIQETIYPLWDIGLEVGYATRSLKECVRLANQDYEVLTSLLDARFICGMSNLYARLMEETRKKILKPQTNAVISWLIDTNRNRHERFGDSAYLLEPNLKEGRGGLRDYHTMLWIARIKTYLKESRDLEYHGYLSHDEYRSLEDALGFVWTVRNRLHHLTGRKCDQLYFEYQIKLAEAMDFKPKNGQQPVEVFLGKLHSQMEYIKEKHLVFLYEQGFVNRKRRKKSKSRVIETGIEGLTTVRDSLTFSSPEAIVENPNLLIKIFETSAKLKIPMAGEAKRLVREFLHLVDGQFSTSRDVVRSFEKILTTAAPTFNVLNEMLKTGFLVALIPEFKTIVDRIQYDEYHLYPVDRHSLRTVRLLKTFGTPEDSTEDPLCGRIYKDLQGRKLLLWAALLHDIGKGAGTADHSGTGSKIAGKILSEKGYKPSELETVEFLVKNHILLVKTATRRDTNDEETAIVCARRIGDAKRLKMLYLLTVADSMATGPKAWNSWTATLLRDLFLKVLNIIENGELASKEALEVFEIKKTGVLDTGTTGKERRELEAVYRVMSPRYLLFAPVKHIVEHIGLYRHLGEAEFVWKIGLEADSEMRDVTICAKDRPGLVSKIAGVFTLNNIDILDTQVFTWRNGIALDIFTVRAPLDRIFESERWEKTAKNLTDALSGELDLSKALEKKLAAVRSAKTKTWGKPNRVVVDNESSSFFTIVEVFTYDFPGLLFSVTDALLRCGLDVWVAKIATYVDQVVDVFYVRDFNGQKVDAPDRVDRIRSTVESVLQGSGKNKR